MRTVKKYRICKIEAVANDVEMMLQEASEPPSEIELEKLRKNFEAEHGLDPAKIIDSTPVPQNEEERFVDGQLKAIKKYAPGVYELMMKGGDAIPHMIMPAMTFSARRVSFIMMNLSREDYVKLGSPSLSDTVEITLKKVPK